MKNILTAFFLFATLFLFSQNSVNKEDIKPRRLKSQTEHLLALKGAVSFSNYNFYEVGLTFLTPQEVHMWGGTEPYTSFNIGASYIGELKSNGLYNGYNIDIEQNATLVNFRLRWTSLFNSNISYGHYISPGIGVGIFEYLYFQFDFRIPLKRKDFDLRVFNFSINFNIPFIGKRF